MRYRLLRWMFLLVLLLALLPGLRSIGEAYPNLVPNGSFEEIDDQQKPVDWFAYAYRAQAGYSRMVVTDEKAHSGQFSALVENANANDARFVCTLAVEPERLYRFSGYILVETMGDQGKGANLALEELYASSQGLFDTQGQWQYVEWYGETGPGQRLVEIGVRVGGYGAESIGKAYFDDIVVQEVNSLPEEAVASLWYKSESSRQVDSETDEESGQKSTAWFVALAILYVVLALMIQPLLEGERERLIPAGEKRGHRLLWAVFGLLLFVAFMIRVVLAYQVEGYQVDINCFTAWSTRMAEVGPAKFYAEGYFCDYPPGALLVLWPIGLLIKGIDQSLLGMVLLPLEQRLLFIKLIPILCDLIGALYLFSFSRKRIPNKAAMTLSLLYALNPATLVNGAAWGQIDSLLALLMMLTASFAIRRQWRVAVPLFVVGVLTKPQALLLAPVALIWLLVSITREKGRGKELKEFLLGLLIALVCAVAIVFPFAIGQPKPLAWLIGLYGETLGSYGYAAVNAANLYYLLGANWVSIDVLVPAATALVFGAALLGLGVLGLIVNRVKINPRAGDQQSRSRVVGPGAGEDSTRRFALSVLLAVAGVLIAILGLIGLSYGILGTLLMVFVFAWVAVCCFTDRRPERLPFWMTMALIGVYVLGVKIHERYLFIGLPLLLMAYATTRDKRMLGLLTGFSATTFVNTAIVLDNSILFGSKQGHLNPDTLGLNVILCLINLFLCAYAGYISFVGVRESKPVPQAQAAKRAHTPYKEALLCPRDARLHLEGKDWLIMGITTVLYACLTFTNLGSTVAPRKGWVSTSPQETITFELEAREDFSLVYYAGVSYENFSVAVSEDGVVWSQEYPCEMRQGLCYRWQYAIRMKEDGSGFLEDYPQNILWLNGKYLRLTAGQAGLNLLEIMARDAEGTALPMQVVGHAHAKDTILGEAQPPENLLDEQNTLRGEPGWFNGTYFDEIYHARTAYEHLHGLPPYETTHPPLGKLMMAAGIALFGMTPFGWRFAGALVGVLMLPVLYLLAKQLTRRRDLATFAMLLFGFDLMHFTQTRIATIDSFPVLFILLSFLCMARYLMTDVFALEEGEPGRLFSRAFWKSLISLAFSGLFMGLSIASKWIGLYSAVGLAVLFFIAVYRQFRMHLVSFEPDLGDKELTSLQQARLKNVQDFTLPRILITCGFCLFFFLLVPGMLYFLSYVPYLKPTGAVTIQRVWQAQQGMLNYHSTPGLGMDHPFQSPWWQWPLILKPMWFAQDRFEPEGFASTIICMGNPLIFYVGAVAMVAVMALFVRKYLSFEGGIRLRDGDGNMALTVLVVGFLAQFLPWVLVPRSMFIYHYFASVPFIILATTWIFSCLPEGMPRLRRTLLWGYAALAAVFFVMFYPYASGMLTPTAWLDAMKWFPKLYY
ncbi:MAG: phospholipid carrier-dependent glycosyltransferase [Clostridiales bacterium]|nr:phospholipid carrier-dependent glycosyltransferase [Clostridiales bacterium]